MSSLLINQRSPAMLLKQSIKQSFIRLNQSVEAFNQNVKSRRGLAWLVVGISILMVMMISINLSNNQYVIFSVISRDDSTSQLIHLPSIALVVVGDRKHERRYKSHYQSLKCYAHRWSQTSINRSSKQSIYFESHIPSIDLCAHHRNFFFRKHCAVAYLMEQHEREGSINQPISETNAKTAARYGLFVEGKQPTHQSPYDWLLVLDGDTFVVNANQSLNQYLPTDPSINIVFYERFHNGEIMAGNYLVRNYLHNQSANQSVKQFLLDWSMLEFQLPMGSAHNHDNGALHLLILEKLFQYQQSNKQTNNQSTHQYLSPLISREALETCRSLWYKAGGIHDYDRYIGCVKCLLGSRRSWPEIGVAVRRRGTFAVRDYFVSSKGDGQYVDNIGLVGPNDLFFHGYKSSPVGMWWDQDVKAESCGLSKNQSINQSVDPTRWTPPLIPSVQTNSSGVELMVKERSRYAVSTRHMAMGIDDVADCWPNCPDDLTDEQTIELRTKLCPLSIKVNYGLATQQALDEHNALINERETERRIALAEQAEIERVSAESEKLEKAKKEFEGLLRSVDEVVDPAGYAETKEKAEELRQLELTDSIAYRKMLEEVVKQSKDKTTQQSQSDDQGSKVVDPEAYDKLKEEQLRDQQKATSLRSSDQADSDHQRVQTRSRTANR